MRIVVTGCSGYIGQRLCQRLFNEGHEIVGIDRESYDGKCISEFVQCDLLDAEKYQANIQGADAICHLAAAKGDWGISDEEYYRDNLEVTKVLLQVGRDAGINNWVFYSTVSALGPSDVPLDENAPRRPANAYGGSKAACEELFERYIQDVPRSHVIVIRPSVVFGPGNPWNTNIHRLIDAIYRRRFIMIGSGQHIKTTSYIDNLIDAQLFLMKKLKDNAGIDIYHYVDSPAGPTENLVFTILKFLGRKTTSIHLPLWIASPLALVGDMAAALFKIDLPITSARVRKFCTSTNFSGQKIRKLGFSQAISNEDAVRYTVKWYLTEWADK